MRLAKREGDGATPIGVYRIIGGFWRNDRRARPAHVSPLAATNVFMGWCDDPKSKAYNRLVKLPFAGSHELLWREDDVYDFVLVLEYNMRPARRELGSAIFIHVARPDFEATAGCIALRAADLVRLLPRLAKDCVVRI